MKDLDDLLRTSAQVLRRQASASSPRTERLHHRSVTARTAASVAILVIVGSLSLFVARAVDPTSSQEATGTAQTAAEGEQTPLVNPDGQVFLLVLPQSVAEFSVTVVGGTPAVRGFEGRLTISREASVQEAAAKWFAVPAEEITLLEDTSSDGEVVWTATASGHDASLVLMSLGSWILEIDGSENAAKDLAERIDLSLLGGYLTLSSDDPDLIVLENSSVALAIGGGGEQFGVEVSLSCASLDPYDPPPFADTLQMFHDGGAWCLDGRYGIVVFTADQELLRELYEDLKLSSP